ERERGAMEAERAAGKYKQVEYMRNFLGEEFEGVITGVAGFGFWVETIAHKCEGLVSLSSLSDFDDFMHVEEDYALVGRRSGRKFRMGDKVWIKVVAANLGKRQLDYEWVIATALANARQERRADGAEGAHKPPSVYPNKSTPAKGRVKTKSKTGKANKKKKEPTDRK